MLETIQAANDAETVASRDLNTNLFTQYMHRTPQCRDPSYWSGQRFVELFRFEKQDIARLISKEPFNARGV